MPLTKILNKTPWITTVLELLALWYHMKLLFGLVRKKLKDNETVLGSKSEPPSFKGVCHWELCEKFSINLKKS